MFRRMSGMARMLTRRLWGGLAIAVFALACGTARAGEAASAWQRNDQAAARLIAAVTAVGDVDRLPIGLQMELQPGWKTYWRAPRDSGLPVALHLAGPRKLRSAS